MIYRRSISVCAVIATGVVSFLPVQANGFSDEHYRKPYAGVYFTIPFGDAPARNYRAWQPKFGLAMGVRHSQISSFGRHYVQFHEATTHMVDISFSDDGFDQMTIAGRSFAWDPKIGLYADGDEKSDGGGSALIIGGAVVLGLGLAAVAVSSKSCGVSIGDGGVRAGC